MSDRAARLLRLLALLQSGRPWTGADLSARLEVEPRTVRRDVEQLRGLGYRIHASSGVGGGYRFGAGTHLPPLLFDDDEAVALIVALRQATGSVARVEETTLRVLLKLDQILPSRLRARLDALQSVMVSLTRPVDPVDPTWLTTIAAACRDRRRLGFAYRDGQQRCTTRDVEPVRLAHTDRRWYLVAWDRDRADWRTFRIDRLADAPTVGPSFAARPFPGDIADYVNHSVLLAPYADRARVELPGSAAVNAERVPAWVGVLEAVDEHRCVLNLAAPTLEGIVGLLVMLGLEFRWLEPAARADDVGAIAERLSRAIAPGAGSR